MRKLINAILLAAMILSSLATVRPLPVMAACEDGGTGDDVLVCNSDTDLAANNDDDIDGDLGNDTITVGSDVTAVGDVDGDGLDSTSPDDLPANGNGGNDIITVDGEVGAVYGDYVTGAGGDDTIVINGEVDGVVEGDDTEIDDGGDGGSGGNDTITVNGTVGEGVIGDDAQESYEGDTYLVGGNDSITVGEDGSVGYIAGDGNSYDDDGDSDSEHLYFVDGNDTITVNGYVDYIVAGDGNEADFFCDEACSASTNVDQAGGNDNIFIGSNGNVGPVLGEGSQYSFSCTFGCGSTTYGGNDQIVIDGEAYGYNDDVYLPAFAGDGILVEAECAEDCGHSATGGNDTVVLNGVAHGDGYGDGIETHVFCEAVCGASLYGGDDSLTVNGTMLGNIYGDALVSEVGCGESCDSDAGGGNDTITINGDMVEAYVSGDGIALYSKIGDDYAYGGNDTITITSAAYVYVIGDDIYAFEAYGGDDTLVVAATANDVYAVAGDGLNAAYGQGGDDTIVIDGSAFYVTGDGTETTFGSLLRVGGPAADCECGEVDGGNDTITINGTAGFVYGDGVTGCAGDDTININGNVLYDVYADDAGDNCNFDHIVADYSGNDTVNIGGGGVSYSTVCGDISVTNVTHHQGTVGGQIYGDDPWAGGGFDSLNFGLVTADQSEVDSLNAYLASLDPNGGVATVNGQTYSYESFERLTVQAVLFSQGAQRLYDDGVTIAFAASNGIQVCNGPSGQKAGLIDYGSLINGERQFGQNGFVVTLTDLGPNQFEVHVWKDGVEQINDANHDGAADSLFVFGN